MRTYCKELIEKVENKFGEDEDVKRLIKAYRDEVDDEGERDKFYAIKMEDYLNACPNDAKFLKYVRDNMHRYLQGEFINLICHAISVLGEDNYYTDGRNEGAAITMRKIKKACKDNDIYLGDMFLKID